VRVMGGRPRTSEENGVRMLRGKVTEETEADPCCKDGPCEPDPPFPLPDPQARPRICPLARRGGELAAGGELRQLAEGSRYQKPVHGEWVEQRGG
jgi:hypothetical protein